VQEKCEDPVLKTSNELFYFPERRIRFAGALISVFLSAVLLIGAIVCLLVVASYSMALRVGMIVLFTGMFAVVVGLLTNARRAEIFGSTAA
jgi:Flp pilus assembly protein TadB